MAGGASTTRIGCRSLYLHFLTFRCVRMKCVGWIADARAVRGYDCDCCDCDCDCDDEGDDHNASAVSAVSAVSAANGYANAVKTRSR